MPLIHDFRSTNVWKAFTLNSIASTLIIFVAMNVRDQYAVLVDKDNNVISRRRSLSGVLISLFITFVASMIAYTTMYFVFGFGGGMLVNTA